MSRLKFIALAGWFLLARSVGQDPMNHWAFRPLTLPSVPVSRSSEPGIRNPIDAFITAKLAEKGLAPSPEADRHTLMRRLYFDLWGLPPAPEEVTAFERDPNPDAYEQLVERLLASPRFGERWARHWLDVVRFAETHGFEMNNPRPNAWPYRDYVIRAFNDDLPFDRFIMEQVAGDAMGVEEATGFLVAGPWDQVKSPDEVLTKNQRADELHDMINTTGTAFLGLTLGCSRCHDHKFDPIPQRDYYAIKAVFDGVQHAERPRVDKDAAARVAATEAARTELAMIERQLVRFEPVARVGSGIDPKRLRGPVHPRMNVELFAAIGVRKLRFTVNATTDLEPCIDELEVYGVDGRNIGLASAGTTTSASGTYPNSEIHRLEHVNDGRLGNSRSWISNERGKGWVQLDFPDTVRVQRIVWARDREEKFKDRLPTDYRIEVSTAGAGWTVVASSADRRAYKAGEAYQSGFGTNGLTEAESLRLADLLGRQKAVTARLQKLLASPMVYAGEFKQPSSTHRFHRGDPMQEREVVEPGSLTFVTFRPDSPTLSTNTVERQRRQELARWMASESNPLTPRVIVNRLWQWHFGEGLVSTPSDFGRNGAAPTHPELLDWLASELIHPATATERAWSLKHVHRLIVTSGTYRQSARIKSKENEKTGRRENGTRSSSRLPVVPTSPELDWGHQVLDAENRLLWHFPSRRLEAEPLRDAILAVAGRLELRMGGPGWSPFEPNENYVRVYTPKGEFGPDDFRRMVYATVIRQRPDGVFGAFDCPDGGQVAPKRTRSTTPLQAFNLLNSGFILQASAFLAARLETEGGADPEAQVRRGFALAFQREPSGDELAASVRLVRGQGLKMFCRALFNANEFAYVF